MATTFNPTPSSIQIGRMLFRHPMAPRQMAPSTGARPQFQGGGGIPDSPMAPFSGAIGGTGLGRADTVPMHVPSGSYVLPADIVSHIGQGNSIAGQDVLRKMFGPWPYGATTGPYGAAMPQGAKGKGMGIPQPQEVRTRGMPRFQVGPGVAQNVVRPSPASGIPGDRHGGAVHPGEPGSQFLDRMRAQTRATPIMASAGEFVIRPDEVARRGGGDLNKGHKLLDMWVKHLRQQHIKTLSKLPGPAK
jgi:hypothetical protein